MDENFEIIENLDEYRDDFQKKADEYLEQLGGELGDIPQLTHKKYAARVMFLIFIVTYETMHKKFVNPDLNLEFMFFLALPESTEQINTTLNELVKGGFIVDQGKEQTKGEIYPDSQIDFDEDDVNP